MITIPYWQLVAGITVLWVLLRLCFAWKHRKVNWRYEGKLLTVWLCIVVIARFVYFPLHPENGRLGSLVLSAKDDRPVMFNLVPLVHLFDIYDERLINLFGNIAMFIPMGFIWPFCFRKLKGVGSVVLAGAGFSLLIELSQLLAPDRNTDIDDLITNTVGTLIGALLYVALSRCFGKKEKEKAGS